MALAAQTPAQRAARVTAMRPAGCLSRSVAVPVGPPQYEPICRTCDEYSNPYLDHPRTCDLIQARLEAEAGGRSCCPGRVVAETARIQRDGGCPDGRF